MTVRTQPERFAGSSTSWLRGWRPVVGVTTVAAGATVVTGAFLPWVEVFAGLIPISGVRGANGKILAVAGAVIAAAGIWQLISGCQAARWFGGLAGFAAAAFSAYLLIRLSATMRNLGGDAMAAPHGGPGLAVTFAGSIAAFATLLLPSSQVTFRRRPGADGPGTTKPTGAGAAVPVTARLGSLTALRRGLQVALAVLWLLDAALQCQPAMFGKSFASMMLAPAETGQPGFVAGPVELTARIVAAGPVAWNALFATIQLALGVGLLFRVTTRAALAGTVAWSLSVWWLAEGLGGIFTGTANPLTGAPGAALLYSLLAVLAWPPASRTGSNSADDDSGSWLIRAFGQRPDAARGSVAQAGPLGGAYAKIAWLILWLAMAALMMRAPYRTSALTAGGGMPALIVATAFAAAFVFAAIGLLFPATAKASLITAAVAGLVIWVAGEHFGSILSGMATDPNSGALLVLLAVAFWPTRRESAEIVRDNGFCS